MYTDLYFKYETDEDKAKIQDIIRRFEDGSYSKLTEQEQLDLDRELHEYERSIYIKYILDRHNNANEIIQDLIDNIKDIKLHEYENQLIINKQRYELGLLNYKETKKQGRATAFNKKYVEDLREKTINCYKTFFSFAFYDRGGDYLEALDIWNIEELDIEPIPPKGIENYIGKGQAYKIKDFKAIYDKIETYIKKKYIELYPGRKEEANKTPINTSLIRAQQPIIHYRAINTVNYPLDRPNKDIWRSIEKEQSGQLTFAFETGRDKDTTVICALSWDDPNTRITKHLTEWDKRVYIATASLFDGGNETVTLTQIYKIMGNDGSPAPNQVEKINDSLTKMGTARLYIDNQGEINKGFKYPAFKYDAPLLPFERITATVNGKETTAIHILKEPPLISFARGRKQITTIDLELLKSPISKTDDNLRIDDFLLEYIAHLKKDRKLSSKITFDTICKACNATTKKQKQRLPKKIEEYLKHYTKCEWIIGYTMDDNKDITIEL